MHGNAMLSLLCQVKSMPLLGFRPRQVHAEAESWHRLRRPEIDTDADAARHCTRGSTISVVSLSQHAKVSIKCIKLITVEDESKYQLQRT